MPKRILAIDGGGVRGIVALAFLEELEAQLRREHGGDYALRDHFDLIGGTSTGALIASGLALGLPAERLTLHYRDLAPQVFRQRWTRPKYARATYLGTDLDHQIGSILGDRRLDSADLRPGGLAVITKRYDTGSVWIITNNPKSPYWADGDGYIGNRHYLLSQLVRASAAAPLYFSPERIEIVKGQTHGIFVDGAVSPHNNPALALFQVATIPAYGYAWPANADELEIVSVGNGSFRVMPDGNPLNRTTVGFAIQNLMSLIADSEVQTLTLMQALGRNETPWPINSEIGDLAGVCIAPTPLFSFRRYNILLDQGWLEDLMGTSVTPEQLHDYRQIDVAAAMEPLYAIARTAAARQVWI